ncbi:MAG: SM-20-related protein [Blastocatellia bacterium]|nr:SM-20-related protein [Blastocatellia bacterium]
MLRGFLSPDVYASLRSAALTSPTTQAPVYIEGSDERIHETVRKTTSFHPDAETISRIHDQLLQQKAPLEEYFRRRLIDCEPPQFLHYREGDFFVRHQDGNTEQLEFDHLKIRRISIVVFLNSFSAEAKAGTFCGGQLNFYDQDDKAAAEPWVFSLKGEAGLLVAFPADTFHEVMPVVRGERFTIISWFR